MKNSGSAIYAFDQITTGLGLELTHCTFGDNQARNGCIVFQSRKVAKISACLFKGNFNQGDPTRSPELRDILAREEEEVSLEIGFPNWTDSPEVSLNLVAPEQRSTVFQLAPLARWGGQIVSTPIMVGAELDPEVLDRIARSFEPLDALNEVTSDVLIRPGQSTLNIYRPGAVQRLVGASEVITASVTGVNESNQLILAIGGKSGLRWRVETSAGLRDFVPTDIVLNRTGIGEQTVLVPLPTLQPDRFFVRLVSEP